MKKSIRIEGDRIYLKELVVKDVTSDYCSWLNDKEVNKYLETKKAKIKDLKIYVKNKRKSSDCLFFGIFLKKEGRHIGNIKLEPINWIDKSAVMGIMIGDKNYWGGGFGREAIKTLINWTFKKINIDKIELGVLKDNKNAIISYQKTGFEIFKEEDKLFKMRIIKNI